MTRLTLPPEWTEGDIAILARRARDLGKDPVEVLRYKLGWITKEQAEAILERVEGKAEAR